MIFPPVFCITVTVLLSLTNASKVAGPTVALRNPKGSLVEGHILKTDLGNDIHAYQDIPYAEPPIGERRFQKSVLSQGWKGTIIANQTKKVCLQQPLWLFDPPGGNFTEDCLVLSVYSPTKPYSTKKYPVMVWIHGGGFRYEAGVFHQFNPKYFTDEGILMVTINYRLGAMGFLTTGDDVIPDNLGLHDQLLAFRWVYENIDIFGGDRTNIVIAGESGGAASVWYHLLGSKPAKYYNAAIMHSGSAASPWCYDSEKMTAALKFAQTLNPAFKAGNSSSILKVLQQASEHEINRTLQAITDYQYMPTIGSGDDFAEYQIEAIDNGRMKQIPALVGFNSEEGLLYFSNETAARAAALAEDANGAVDKNYNVKEADRKAAFESVRRFYTKGDFSDDLPAFIRYYTDTQYLRPILRTVQGYSKYVKNTYLYQLGYRPSTYQKPGIPGIDGVGHTADLQLLFDEHGVAVNFTETDKKMSKRIVKIWSNFIKHRNPTPHPDPLLENISWPRVTPDKMNYLNLTTSLSFETNPRQMSKWKDVWDKYLQHPIGMY